MQIDKRSRAELKQYFVKNAIPTESNFAELIDGMMSQKDDGIAKLPNDPLSIEAAGDATSQKKAIQFYASFADADPTWVISLNPRRVPTDAATARPGFSISNAAGASRLFIERDTGQVGIGTVGPLRAALQIDRAGLNAPALLLTSASAGWGSGLMLENTAGGKTYGIYSGAGALHFADVNAGVDRILITGNGDVGIGTNAPAGAKLQVIGAVKANRFTSDNGVLLNDFTSPNPPTNVYLYSPSNDRDAWIYLDSVDTGSNWGIYHRQIDSPVRGLPPNSIGFVGGGSSRLQAYVNLGDGSGYFAGSLRLDGSVGVGSGQATLPAKLSLGTNLANTKLALHDDPNDLYGFGIQGSQLRIHVGNAGARFSFLNAQAGTEVMTVKGSGRVGIGTADPVSDLAIRHDGSGALGPVLTLINGSGGADAGGAVDFNGYDVGANAPTLRLRSLDDGNFSSHLAVYTKDSGAATTSLKERLRLTSAGNLGVGTATPQKKIHVQGASSGPVMIDGNDRPAVVVTGSYPELELFSNVNNTSHGPTIRLGAYTDGTATTFKHWVIGTSGRNASFLDVGFSDKSDPNPHAGIRNYNGKTVMTLLETGTVGIGTTAPRGRLDVPAGDIWVGQSLNISAASDGTNGGVLNIYNETSKKFWHINIRSGEADKLIFWRNDASATPWAAVLKLGMDGLVEMPSGALVNAIGVGTQIHGKTTWPYETIQMNPANNLRVWFGTTQRYVFQNNGVFTIAFDQGYWVFQGDGNLVKYNNAGKALWASGQGW